MHRLGAALVVAALVGAVAVGGQQEALAQDTSTPITWAVAPADRAAEPDRPNFVIDARPGQTVSDSLVVANRSSLNLVLGVYARDAFNTPDGRIDLLTAGQSSVDVGAWTTPGSDSITVPAGGQIDVPFTIVVPADAEPGDHVGGIVTSLTVTEQDADGNRVQVERRLGTRISLRVEGELRPQLEFTKVDARYAGTWNPFVSGSMAVTYTVRNTGNVRLRSQRIARVATGLGLPERSADADDMAELLPGNSYDLRQTVTGVWPAFGTRVEVELQPYDSFTTSGAPAAAAVVGTFRTSMFPTPQVITIAVVLVLLARWWRRRRTRRTIESTVEAAAAKSRADLTKVSP